MNSIKQRVLLVLVGAGMLPMIAIFFLMKEKTSEAVVDCQYEKLEAVAEEVARQVSTTMERSASDLESLRFNPLVVGKDTPMAVRIDEMKRLVKAYRRFSDITLYAPDGFMIASTTDTHHPEPEEFTRWFYGARDGGEIVTSVPHRVNGQRGLHMKVYIPVRITGIDGTCVMKARLTFDDIWARTDGVKLGGGGQVVLIDARGKILSCEDKSRIFEDFDETLEESFFEENASGEYRDAEGSDFIFASVVIPPEETQVKEEWLLLALHPKSEVAAALHESNRFLYVSGALTLAVSVLLGSGLTRMLSKPLTAAAAAAKEVGKGNLQVRIPSTRLKEMETMAKSFNSMVDEVRTHRFHLEQLVDSRTRRLRQSQQELEDLSAQLKATYESTQEGVLVVKADGTILTSNRRLAAIFGLEGQPHEMTLQEFEGRLGESLAESSDFRRLWRETACRDDKVVVEDWELVKPRPTSLQVYSAPVRNSKGEIFARLWMFQDVTEHKQLQRGLQQAQKMEAIGRLAGGVAHDFNNLLTGIIGNLQLVELSSAQAGGRKDGDDEGNCIVAAKKAGLRAAELVKQLLGFSRRSHLELEHADANAVIRDVGDLLRASLDPSIRVSMNLAGELGGVRIDSTQMEQVIMNMCENSGDAIQESGKGGTITLTTKNHVIRESEVDHSKGERAGDFVVISVSDDGAGIPADVLENIFEPFFTTKSPGKGTGLGLATSFGIVQQHGGWIHCSSEVGRGTTFEIYLPREDKPVASSKAVEEETAIRGGGETILLVDDEEFVSKVAEGMLKHFGYRILKAKDGLKALEVLEAHGDEISLVLLDMTMPNLTGDETFARIRKEIGDVPVVVCSGYVVDLDEFGRPAGCRPEGFVQKPYAVRDLAEQIRNVLDRHAAAAAV